MSKIIAASIDLNKIDKARIKSGKNGAKYYDISIFVNDEANQYGQDISIATGQTKEEREAKVKASYIGNGKTVFDSDKGHATSAPTFQSNTSDDNDSLPF